MTMRELLEASGGGRWPFLALRWMFPLRTLSGTLCLEPGMDGLRTGAESCPLELGCRASTSSRMSLHIDPRQ